MNSNNDLIQRICEMSDEAVAYIQESRFGDHNPRYQSLEDSWRMARRRWMGDHWDTKPRRGLKSYVVNRNQTAIASQTANQLGASGIRTQIEPIESDDAPVFAINPAAGRRIMAAIGQDSELNDIITNMLGLSEDHLLGDAAISKEVAETLLSAIESPGVDEMGAPIPPIIDQGVFSDEDIIELDDALFAKIVNDTYQTKFDLARGNYYAYESEIRSNNYGHQPIIFQWDEDSRNFEFRTPSPFSVLPDPNGTCVEEMQWLIFDQIKTVRETILDFPKHKEAIEEAQQTGTITSRGGKRQTSGINNAGFTLNQNDVPKVVIRTVWIRNEEYPMEEVEVVDKGWATRNVPEDGGEGEYLTLTREGEEAGLGQAGEVFARGDKTWPKVPGIRQVQMIEDTDIILTDMRCPFWDIPVAWNKNFPLLDGPFGISEHMRLEDIQSMINRVVSMIYNMLNYNQCPQQVMSTTMAESLKDFGTALHAHPNRIAILNDGAWQQLASTGFKGMFVDPPQVPSAWVNILQMLFSEHDMLSGNNNVVQGRAPFSGASGRTVEALQSAALGVLNLRSLNTQWAFERIARLGSDAMIKFMPPSEWRKFASKYPNIVFKMMRQRIKRMEYDVKVVIQAGRGMSKQIDRENALQEYQLGLATKEQTLEKIGVENPRAVSKEIEREQQKAIAEQQNLDVQQNQG